jgi:hypothetical protein
MPWVATLLPWVVLQQAICSDPQLEQVWVATSFACLPWPTWAMVVLQAPQRCETTVLVATPCGVTRLPPFAALSGSVMNTSWHLAHDMGLESPGVTVALEELALDWSILSPPLSWGFAEPVNADTARTARIAIMFVFIVLTFC